MMPPKRYVKLVMRIATRQMSQLACRFCANSESVHVVDPLLDLRFRFENKQQLQSMLRARKIEVNIDDVEFQYQKWWKAYENVCADSSNEHRDASLKKLMLDENEGLLGALRLPNDLVSETPVEGSSLKTRSMNDVPKHLAFLRKAGMVKMDEATSALHTVGLPTSLQDALEKTIVEHFAKSAMLVSPPHMVRGAVIEAVNLPKEMFPLFSDSNDEVSASYLTGHGLVSLVSMFTKTHFTKSTNKWPIRMLSSGASYRNYSEIDSAPNLFDTSQRHKVAILTVCSDEQQESDEYKHLTDGLDRILRETLSCPIKKMSLRADGLFNYESCATSLVYGDAVEIARVSRSGTYIPSRLNIVTDGKDDKKTDFVRLVYAEIDLTRSLGMIIEEHLMGTKPVPDLIKQML